MFLSLCLLFGISSTSVFAFQVQSVDSGIMGDFILSPAKQEVVLDPGTSMTHRMTVINRTAESRDFSVSVEDIAGTRDIENPVVLFGEASGPYSLAEYVVPELTVFTLAPQEQATFNVDITLPEMISPGGLYGAVLISSESEGLGGASGAEIISRVASLILVTVAGDANYEGKLLGIDPSGVDKTLHYKAPEGFELSFENTGSVHLAPEGIVRIVNMFGRETDLLRVKPFFVLPDSVRSTEVVWEHPGLRFGRYTAIAEIARGYNDEVDVREVSFWVIPLKEIAIVFVLLIILAVGIRFRGTLHS